MEIKPEYKKESHILKTGKCRLSYPHLFKPQKAQKPGEEGKYAATLLIPKTDKNMKAMIDQAMKDAAVERWADKIPKGLKSPLKDGDLEEVHTTQKGEIQESYKGNWVLRTTSKTPPGCILADARTHATERDMYPGCYVRAFLSVFAWEQPTGRGVSFALNHIQKVDEGEALGRAQTRAEDVFDAIVAENEGESIFG